MATKEIFRTQFTPHKRSISPAGEKIEIRHRAEIGTDGKRRLVKDRKVAIYDLIQSNKEECEIENIIRRSIEGDYNALNAKQGVFADITGMPKSIAEAQQLVINLKESFDKLPKEIKAKFEHNAEIYVAEYGTDTWAEKTGYKAALETAKAAAERKTKFDENMAKAVEKLATGSAVTQKGVEE